MAVLTDPADCGPVTLAFCQDVQTEAYDYPEASSTNACIGSRRVAPDPREVAEAAALLRQAKKPLVVCGGGVLYSDAERDARSTSASRRGIPVAETQAGKSAMPGRSSAGDGRDRRHRHGAPPTRSPAEADVILGVGTRFADFTTGSWALFQNPDRRFIGINVQPFDAAEAPRASPSSATRA